MGFKQSLVCPNCSYDVLTSGGPDMGFDITTNTFCCVACKILIDLEVEPREYNLSDGNTESSVLDELVEGQKCSKCKGSEFKLWDNEKMQCPKCGTKMNLGGTIMLWD